MMARSSGKLPFRCIKQPGITFHNIGTEVINHALIDWETCRLFLPREKKMFHYCTSFFAATAMQLLLLGAKKKKKKAVAAGWHNCPFIILQQLGHASRNNFSQPCNTDLICDFVKQSW
jgi:hypothetical protein